MAVVRSIAHKRQFCNCIKGHKIRFYGRLHKQIIEVHTYILKNKISNLCFHHLCLCVPLTAGKNWYLEVTFVILPQSLALLFLSGRRSAVCLKRVLNLVMKNLICDIIYQLSFEAAGCCYLL